MALVMKAAAAVSFLLTALFGLFCRMGFHWAIPWAITFGTFFYHFAMRLLVGHLINRKMQNKADYRKPWYRLRPFEEKLYNRLKVKKWKGKMPTYDPATFDPKLHSWDEIAQAMCQAEIVHEVIAVLSFLPLLAAIPFGAFPVFFITSLVSAMYDLTFVILQRYNRPRILKILNATYYKKVENPLCESGNTNL